MVNLNYQEVAEGVHRFRELNDVAFIVEGIHDKKVLEKLGIKNIFTYAPNAQKVVENVKSKGFERAVILTDFDDEGRRKKKEIKEYLQASGIKVDNSMRMYFRETFKITAVEELNYYYKNCDFA